MDNLNLLALYILPFIGGINWRFGLLQSPPYSSDYRRVVRRKRWKNRMILLKGYIVRVFVLFAIWVILVHLGWIQINSWWALFCWGVPYVLIAWFLNIFATGFEECCIFKLGKNNSDVSEKTATAWVSSLVVLLVIYVVVRVVVWRF